MKPKSFRGLIGIGAALAALLAGATDVRAQSMQIHPSFYGASEWDTQHMQFYLLGIYLSTGGRGWSPYANASAYSLQYRVGTKTERSTTFSPSAGLAYHGERSGLSFGGGYSMTNKEAPASINSREGGSNGVTTSFSAYQNGLGDRPYKAGLQSSYNFGSKYLWTRARGSVPLGYSTVHPARIGLELVGQGGGKRTTSTSFAVGPTLEYQWTPKFTTTAASGAKFNNTSGGASNTAAYAKLEFSFSP